jgi:RNA polymerase sigma factor (sigma-70 family)
MKKSRYLTEIDLVQNYKRQIWQISSKLESSKFTLKELGEDFPAGISLNSADGNLYANPVARKVYRKSQEELLALGADFFKEFTDQEELLKLHIQIFNNYQNLLNGKSMASIQRVKPSGSNRYRTFLIIYKLLQGLPHADPFSLEEPDDPLKLNIGKKLDVKCLLVGSEVRNCAETSAKIDYFLESNELGIRFYHLFEKLTSREKEIIRHSVSGLDTQQIAQELQISLPTLTVHKKSIYRKLEIKSWFELLRFAQAFEMV